MGDGVLDGLADREPERAGVVRRLGEDLPPVLRVEARAGHDLGAVRLHEDPPVRLLVVARPDHVHLDLEVEDRPGEGERAPPLAGPRLGREPGHAFHLVVVRLGQGRVRLVAAGRAAALVLVVDVGRRIERLLEAVGAEERARPIQPVGVADRFRDLDLAVLADDLLDQLHREQRRQVGRSDRLAGAGMEDGRRRDREVRGDVVPGTRDPGFIEHELRLPGIRRRHGALLLDRWKGRRMPPARGREPSAPGYPDATGRAARDRSVPVAAGWPVP